MPDLLERDKLNPGETDWSDKLNHAESRANDGSYADAGIDQAEAYANDSANHYEKEVGAAEETPKSAWDDKTSEIGKGKQKGKGSFGKKKKTLIGLGIGGGAAALIAAALFLLPMKLNMYISNISAEAGKIPGYAIENRVRYLVTRTIAERALNLAKGNSIDSDLVFCKSKAIFCSLYKTYTTSFIEKKFDLKMTAGTGADRLKVTITPLDRSGLGGNAQKWELNFTNFDAETGTVDKKLSVMIDNNKDMKNFLKEHVRQKIPDKGMLGTIKRYISRKVLMRKYGVTRWSAFQKTKAKINDIKASMRASVAKNVFGRVSDRMAILVGCIDSPSACEKTLRSMDNGTEKARNLIPEDKLAQLGDSASEKDLVKALMESIGKTGAKIAFSIGAAATVIGTALTINTVMKIINALDTGVIDKALSGVMEAAYIAYDYGDDIGVVTNAEAFMAGGLDLDSYGAITSMLDGATASPLMAAENGISNPIASILFSNNAYAEGNNVKSGQLVPDNMKIGQHVTGDFMSNPFVSSVDSIIPSGIWTKWVTPVIDGVTDLVFTPVTFVLNSLGITSLVSSLTSGTLNFLLDFFGFIPQIGVDKPGTNNYIALSGGIRTESNESMLGGQSSTGELDGAGGKYLSTEQVAAIDNNYSSEQPQSSYLAGLFSPNVKGSLTQQVALMAPSNTIGFLNMLLNVPSSIFAGFFPSSRAESKVSVATAMNPFDQTLFGYPLNDPALTADPETYTPQECQKLAQEREDSYTMVNGLYKVYTKTDPCALDKTVIGSLLADAGNMTDENSLTDPVDEGTNGGTGASTTTSVAPVTFTDEDMKHYQESSVNISCAAGTTDKGTDDGYFNGVKVPIRICQLPKADSGAIVNSRVSGVFYSMFEQMRSDLNLDSLPPGGGFRTFQQQADLYVSNQKKGLQTAKAGYSNHQGGMAVDLTGGKGACAVESHSGSTCTSSPIYNWLVKNASKYHIYQFDQEWWHWSINGN